jgi:hypothetical protein
MHNENQQKFYIMKRVLLTFYLLNAFFLSDFFAQSVTINKDLEFGESGCLSLTSMENFGTQQDGKIFAIRSYSNDSNIIRINRDGTIDSTFKFQLNDSLNVKKIAALIDNTDGIYVSCINEADYMYPSIIKISYEGELDTTFNNSGVLSFIQDTLLSEFEKLILTPVELDKIYFTYRTVVESSQNLTLRVVNTDGTIDTSYGTYLLEKLDSINGKPFYLFSATITPDDKILVVGQHDPGWYFGLHSIFPTMGNGLIIKLNKNGSVFESFGHKGVVLLNTEEIHLVKSLSILQDMSLLLHGQKSDFANLGQMVINESDNSYSVERWLGVLIYRPFTFYDNYDYLKFPNGNLSLNTRNNLLDINWELNSIDTIKTTSYFKDFIINNNEELFIAQYNNHKVEVEKYKLDTLPTPQIQISDLDFSWNTNNSICIKWFNGDGKRRLIFISESDSIFPGIQDRKTYYPNNNWNNKLSEIKNSGWYCVYNSIGDSTTVYSLDRKKKYWIVGVECNGAADWERYNHSITEGNSLIISEPLSTTQTPFEKINSFNIYPNPSKGQFLVHFSSITPEYVKISNINGIEIYSDSNISADVLTINTMNYSPGIYFVQVKYKDIILTRKVLIY